ncbi:MAG: UvrD-helicase domain-containing protein [Candidatus Marinimicrobia bacterium]|nr:UvrD-helicase domain-containing protein [Candidatus Neomarinimicrobiota bacterium]MBT5070313.1 UvrD-helicase domain-containing protein [Candidatus Neomarinimicrobiota bacterium]
MSLKKLNKTQKAAVEAIDGPVLIFAGAGSGKTRVLTHKMYYLINEGHYKSDQILAVTFTNKAAKEMKSRVMEMLGEKELDISIGTFHSICARLLRNEIQPLGYTRHFAIYDVQDQIDLMKIVLDDMNVPKEMLTPNAARNQISFFKNKMLTPAAQARKARTKLDKLVVDVYAAYQAKLKENDALDFDDLLLKPLELFDRKPEILEKYQQQWKYILVDEYQDTNRPQYQFLTLLAENSGQISVVGDDDQSIYGWRGADVSNILDFEKFFPSCRIFTLEKNYRSTQQILDAATTVVGNNVRRADKQLVAASGKGESIAIIETVDELEEADAIVSALEKEIKLKKRTFAHFAILYRTNAQSRALEDSLRRMGIPYNIVGGIRFYNRKEVKDVVAYLRLVMNLKDTVSLRRVVNFPARGIGIKTIDKCVIQAEKDDIELFDVLKEPTKMQIRGKQSEALGKFYEVINKYHDLRNKLSTSELARSLVEEAGILKYFKHSTDPEDAERYENVAELLHSIDEYTTRTENATLNQFLEEVSLLSDIDHWNDDDNRVTLMTIHSSKGLEFPVVFVAGLDDGLFPLYNSLNTDDGIEEERRLFYVALTRAEKRVYLLYATNRRRMGAENASGMVSRFVREIPEEYLERLNFSSALTRKVVGGAARKATRTKLSRTVTTFDDFRVGDTVEHAIFGSGKIMALSGTGENQRVGVVFKDGVKKKLIVKYANLKKVSA